MPGTRIVIPWEEIKKATLQVYEELSPTEKEKIEKEITKDFMIRVIKKVWREYIKKPLPDFNNVEWNTLPGGDLSIIIWDKKSKEHHKMKDREISTLLIRAYRRTQEMSGGVPPYVFPERKAWGIGDLKHAWIAISYMNRCFGNPNDYPRVIAAIRSRYGDNPKIQRALRRINPNKCK